MSNIEDMQRLQKYRDCGFTKKALSDDCYMIRIEAYRKLGWATAAIFDMCHLVRIEAYYKLDLLDVGLTDPEKHVREKIKLYIDREEVLKKHNIESDGSLKAYLKFMGSSQHEYSKFKGVYFQICSR